MDTNTQKASAKRTLIPAVEIVPKELYKGKPTTKYGRALYSCLNDLVRHAKSERVRVVAAAILAVAEGVAPANEILPLIRCAPMPLLLVKKGVDPVQELVETLPQHTEQPGDMPKDSTELLQEVESWDLEK